MKHLKVLSLINQTDQLFLNSFEKKFKGGKKMYVIQNKVK